MTGQGGAAPACERCGKCCLTNLIAYVTEEDWARWQREGREDILHFLSRQNAVWAGDHLMSATTGRPLHGCPFLAWDRDLCRCTIYETRPQVCRDYVPGSSYLCPLYPGNR